MQDSAQYSRKAPMQKTNNEMLRKKILIKIGELLFRQGLLTLEEKNAFDRMTQERL